MNRRESNSLLEQTTAIEGVAPKTSLGLIDAVALIVGIVYSKRLKTRLWAW